MVTKPVDGYYPKRIKTFAHWYSSDFRQIDELAEKMNLPPHFIMQARSFFVDSHPAIKETFEKWAIEHEDEIRKGCMKKEDYLEWKRNLSRKGAFALKPAAKWFACDQCSKGYLMEATLETHKKMAHPLVAPVIRGR